MVPLRAVDDPDPDKPLNALLVLLNFFDEIQWSKSLFDVKMAAAEAVQQLSQFIA